ncbi:diacylglycerol kinase family protein [bacterium]|nr:diacylglycerol kinase family protein [bacterium]
MRPWLRRRLAAFGHAGRGVAVLLGEPHGRIHAVAAVGVTLLGLALGLSAGDWALLVICIALVLAAEALNSAIERVVDLVSPEWQALARDAKDLAAAGVLIASIGAAVVGLIVFLPHL